MSKADLTMGRVLTLLLAAVLTAACTNNTLDDGGSGDVVLEIESMLNPPVTATRNALSGVCSFTVVPWSITARNRPKNAPAGDSSPFNDISLIDVTMDYDWIDAGLATPQRVFGLGGVVVPVDNTVTVTFPPIALDDLDGAYAGRTSSVTLNLAAVTVEGTRITAQVTRTLNVASCI